MDHWEIMYLGQNHLYITLHDLVEYKDEVDCSHDQIIMDTYWLYFSDCTGMVLEIILNKIGLKYCCGAYI